MCVCVCVCVCVVCVRACECSRPGQSTVVPCSGCLWRCTPSRCTAAAGGTPTSASPPCCTPRWPGRARPPPRTSDRTQACGRCTRVIRRTRVSGTMHTRQKCDARVSAMRSSARDRQVKTARQARGHVRGMAGGTWQAAGGRRVTGGRQQTTRTRLGRSGCPTWTRARSSGARSRYYP